MCFRPVASGRHCRRICRPKSTAYCYFLLWDWDGTLERLHHTLYVATREQEGREANPTAAIIDSQSAKAAQKGL
jgi:transposase